MPGAATPPVLFGTDKVQHVLAFGALPSDRRYRLGRARFPLLADELAASSGERPWVLDAGVGQAKLQRLYAHRHPERPLRWVGVDLLAYRLALRLEVEGLARAQGALEALPFGDASFEAVVCSWVLQHLRDPEQVLRELTRVLRPGGRLLLAVPQRPQPLKLLAELLHPILTRLERLRGKPFGYSPQIQFYDRPRVRRLIRAAGLIEPRWQGIGFVTGGPLKFLENYAWYYALNLRLGRALPGFTQSLLCVATKPKGS